MSASKKLIIPILLTAMILPTSPVMAVLTLQQAVNSIQATDPALPTGVANPKGSIGSLLAELFWGTGDGVKNGKIKPQYIDYSGISAWTQSGSDAYYSGTGSVGIGTMNPVDTANFWRVLDIQSNGGAATYYRASGTNPASQYFATGYSPTAAYLLQANNAPMVFYTNNTEKLRLDATGNVGIGTTSPNKLLHLKTTTGTNAEINIQSGDKLKWGMYHDETSEQLRFWNGADRVTFGSGGNVGIGTSSPSGKLTLWEPTASAIQELRMDGTSGSVHRLSWDLWNKFLEYSQTTGSITFTNATTSDFVIKNNGNIGIGTSSPNAKLQIESVTRTTPANQPLVLTSPTTAIGDKLGISFSQTDNYSRARAGIYAISELANGYASSLGFFTRNAEDGTQLDSADEKMRITSDGRVGIGTTNPWSRLTVVANPQTTKPLYIQAIDDNNGPTKTPLDWSYVPGIIISNDWSGNAATVNSTKIAKIVLNTGAGGYNNGASIHAEGASGYDQGQLIFSTGWNSANLATERMRINASGNVGIGTPTPWYKLTVNGQPAANGYTAFTNYSDSRLKENIADITDGSLEKILKLRPVEYNYNDTYFSITGYDTATKDKKFRWFIAQELKEVFPEMIGEKPFWDKKYLDTDLSNLQIYLVKAIKELKSQKDSEVQELKNENDKLSHENQEIKSLVCLDHPNAAMCK